MAVPSHVRVGSWTQLGEARGQQEMFLHAQLHAAPFYRRYSFVAEGAPYDEVGILHQTMRRVSAPVAVIRG